MGQILTHQPVMLNEAVNAVFQQADGFYVDATFGRGGHSRALLSRLGPQGHLVALDRDPDAAQTAKSIQDDRFEFKCGEFANLTDYFEPASIDGLLLDVGVSSPQLDDPARGFSFRYEGPLDMRMDPTKGVSAADFLAHASLQEITQVIKEYGEERFAFQIAQAIIAHREEKGALSTTSELAKLVGQVVKTYEKGLNPATRTFQALRIHVNAELDQLKSALEASLIVLKPAGRLAVISFHSLEDRIVKQFMLQHSRFVPDRRVPFETTPQMKLENAKRVRPSAAEVNENPRARSAILRSATRTSTPSPQINQGGAHG